MEQDTAISMRNAVAGNPAMRLDQPVSLDIMKGEQIAVIGPNGAGKTLLANLMSGKYPILAGGQFKIGFRQDSVRSIAFRDSYGSADATWCYQQRWNSTETEDSPVIADIFPSVSDPAWRAELFRVFHLDEIWGKKLVVLSSGEMRKYQLAKALSSKPEMLFIDNPYIGLDPAARDELTTLISRLISAWNLQIVFIISRAADLAPFITHVVPVCDGCCMGKIPAAEYCEPSYGPDVLDNGRRDMILSIPDSSSGAETVVRCNGVSLRYGDTTILDKIDWQVHRGSHWSLQGPNGSGKSALLSLVYADNPQAYACDIELFGRPRGTGESIWDIKKHIGYVSPEMHRSYCHHIPVIDIVASGLSDTIGLYRKIHDEERDLCRFWIRIFGLEELESRDFCTLSSGEQRIVLLARAFVKNPSLMILDEPLHGLDERNRALVKAIIDAYCSNSSRTLITVTHYPEELAGLTNQILRLRGRSALRPLTETSNGNDASL
ncbi:MAG: ATP-binding cassette domain-containing protein [Bacteroidaceae bacterium]|nr:ATP-binding cassette domain-containing protein [Bacteroidaceae bacterium]